MNRDSMGVQSMSRFGGRMLGGLCVLLLICQLSCRETRSETVPTTQSEASAEPLPPDVSRCERIRIWLEPSTVDFVCITPIERPLLNPEEIRYLESAAPFIVDSPEVIQTFAKDISSSTYERPVWGSAPHNIRSFLPAMRGVDATFPSRRLLICRSLAVHLRRMAIGSRTTGYTFAHLFRKWSPFGCV